MAVIPHVLAKGVDGHDHAELTGWPVEAAAQEFEQTLVGDPLRFVVALALGFLVGVERESRNLDEKELGLAGVRTFPIIAMFGFGCAWLHRVGLSLVMPVGLVVVAVLCAISYSAKTRHGRYGVTTEVSVATMCVVGALALVADVWIAMAVGLVNAFLLSEDDRLTVLRGV